MTARKIVFATDFSTSADALLEHAMHLARGMEGLLLIVHVASDEPGEESANDDVRRRLQEVAESDPTVACEHRLLTGSPAREICDFAAETGAELIVMGTHGRSGFRRLLPGSVAEAVARNAPCPVLTWRSPAGVSDTIGQDEAGVPKSLPADQFHTSRAVELLTRAVEARATDIHLDTSDDEIETRFRIDGRLEHYCRFDDDMGHALVNQLKILAGVDIAEPFRPKESRFRMPEPQSFVDVRVTVTKTQQGEAMALRLLDRDRLVRPLDTLGFGTESRRVIQRALGSAEGLVLVTGPTGSGKTTTLYSMLNALDDGTRNIVSIEDPVEFELPSFRQIDVDPRHGVTIAGGLRTILRMDPDVILVGEIRDAEAAAIAMRAASSGKNVFSSLHTRDVASTVTAMRDLQIDNHSIAANLSVIVSQRLVRRLCPDCLARSEPEPAEAELFTINNLDVPPEIGRPTGCSRCRQTGYLDRVGVFEVAAITEELSELTDSDASEAQLREVLRSKTQSLFADGLRKVADSVTSMEEVQSMTWAANV